MAAKTVKLLTNSASFPMLYSFVSRSTIDNQDLSPRMPAFTYGDRVNADFGAPQLIFCENMMPFAKGIYSVGYTTQADAISPAVTSCDQAIPIRDIDETRRSLLAGLLLARLYLLVFLSLVPM
jgi:hypothetical protein